jgi:hypothetical protein
MATVLVGDATTVVGFADVMLYAAHRVDATATAAVVSRFGHRTDSAPT